MDSAKWAELLQSDCPYDDTISSKCYCTDFLNLSPLSDDELKNIMAEFAEVSGKPLADSGYLEQLLQTLKKVDGVLQRPIYALAIADAWCSGKDPTRWNKEQILDALVNRELKFYYGRLRNLSKNKVSKEIRSELENLLARSCMVDFLPLNQIADSECVKLRKKANQLDMDFPELLRQIGVVHNIKVVVRFMDGGSEKRAEKRAIEAVILDCPDLIKEFLVLRQAFDKCRLNLLFPVDWDNNPRQLHFFLQLLFDYLEKLEGKSRFWKILFAGSPKSEFPATIYSRLLVGATAQFHGMEKQVMVSTERTA